MCPSQAFLASKLSHQRTIKIEKSLQIEKMVNFVYNSTRYLCVKLSYSEIFVNQKGILYCQSHSLEHQGSMFIRLLYFKFIILHFFLKGLEKNSYCKKKRITDILAYVNYTPHIQCTNQVFSVPKLLYKRSYK